MVLASQFQFRIPQTSKQLYSPDPIPVLNSSPQFRHPNAAIVILNFLGNISVFCRCRPLNADEIGASTAIDFESAKDAELNVRGHVSYKKLFKFDSVFSPGEDQGNFVNEDTRLAITNAFIDWFLLLMCRKGI
jgi:hypothetical protein